MQGQRSRTLRFVLAMVVVPALFVGVRSGAAQQPAQPTVVAGDYDMVKAATGSTSDAAVLEGKKLFVQRCALCHDTLGQPTTATIGPWLDMTTVQSKGEPAIRQQILNGSSRMPGWRHTLKPAQVDQLVTYLKTVTPEQKPKQPNRVVVPVD